MKNLKTFNKYNKLNEGLDSNLCVSLNEDQFYDELDKYPNLNSLLNEKDSEIIKEIFKSVTEINIGDELSYIEHDNINETSKKSRTFIGQYEMDGDLPWVLDHENLKSFNMVGVDIKIPQFRIITIKLPDDYYLVCVNLNKINDIGFEFKIKTHYLYFKCDDTDGLKMLPEIIKKRI